MSLKQWTRNLSIKLRNSLGNWSQLWKGLSLFSRKRMGRSVNCWRKLQSHREANETMAKEKKILIEAIFEKDMFIREYEAKLRELIESKIQSLNLSLSWHPNWFWARIMLEKKKMHKIMVITLKYEFYDTK